MITICIPIYNFDVTSLVDELSRQAGLLNQPYEIILIDDCSNEKFKEINRKVCKNEFYIELAKNTGRSKVRNLFLEYSKYEYLLFLDCDSLIETSDFLSKYFEVIKQKPGLVCGGRIYSKNRPSREKMLRWKYGVLRESRPYTIRNKFPNQSFMTNNFLINKEIFAKVKFDERITQYGHEDTLFGYSLKKENISITHIDNPVVNGYIEDNEEYLSKTKEGIINLIHIIEFMNYDNDLIAEISLLRFYSKIKKCEKCIKLSFVGCKSLIHFLLSRGYVNLYLFDFYKLGIFIENHKNKRDPI
ncbi:MAG: glycosyltransferase family 2 protein [Smithella sp.]|jgi:glycosyltransferase involved in cell wall biosynthesis